MMDLIQLLLPQQTKTATEEANDVRLALQQNDVAFIAMLTQFLNKPEALEVGSEPIPCEVIEVEEEVPEHAEIELLDMMGQEPGLSASENSPFAWFDSESFALPSTKLAVEVRTKENVEKNSSDLDERKQAVQVPFFEPDHTTNKESQLLSKRGAIEQINIHELDLSVQYPIVETSLSVKSEELAAITGNESLFKEKDNIKELDKGAMPMTMVFLEKKQSLPIEKHSEIEVGHSLNLSKNIDNTDWSEQFTHQIIWLRQQKIKTAIIKLAPPELGALEVKVDLVKEETKINIRTQIPEVGELIEQAIPRLRDLMSGQGVQLLQVNIESNSNQRHYPEPQHSHSQQEERLENELQLVETKQNIKLSQGIIDYFA